MKNRQWPEIGWREWLALPQIGVPAVKAKIDTGARTSALHATNIEAFVRQDEQWVRFCVHPLQRRRQPVLRCEAKVADQRTVTSSTGHRELRYVIRTQIALGGRSWPIDLTLTHRGGMSFRMLLGRTALRGRFTINPARSFLTGKALSNTYKNDTIGLA